MAAELVCAVHGAALRSIATALGSHVAGLQQGAGVARQRHLIDSKLFRKLVVIDHAFSLLRHVTLPGNQAFLDELDASFRSGGFNDPPPPGAASDPPSLLQVESVRTEVAMLRSALDVSDSAVQDMSSALKSLLEEVSLMRDDTLFAPVHEASSSAASSFPSSSTPSASAATPSSTSPRHVRFAFPLGDRPLFTRDSPVGPAQSTATLSSEVRPRALRRTPSLSEGVESPALLAARAALMR